MRRVEAGVKCDRVVGLTLQCAETVVMRIADIRVIERVRSRPGENGVRADLDEGAVVHTGGRDRLAEPDRVADVGHPVVGGEQRRRVSLIDGAEDRDPRHLGRHRSQRGS